MQLTARQLSCRDKFEARGFPRSGASALVGGFSQEVGPNLPTAFRKSGLDHGSQGLAQWRLARLTSYQEFVRRLHPGATGDELWAWWGRMDHQIDFVVYELKTDYPQLYTKLMTPGDAAVLAADVCWQYERPSRALSGIEKRIAWAKALAAAPGSKTSISASPTPSDQLHKTVAAHEKQAQGGMVVGLASVVAGVGVTASNVIHDVPTWEWVVFAVLGLLAVVGFVGAAQAKSKAVLVATAAAGVDNVAPPASSVPNDRPVTLPPVVEPPKPPVDTTSPEFQAAVAAEIQRLTSTGKVPGLIGQSGSGPQGGGASMTIGRSQP